MQVGSFYELYEDDAQIGHDVLGWKMTITGVGHCRQARHLLELSTSNKSKNIRTEISNISNKEGPSPELIF